MIPSGSRLNEQPERDQSPPCAVIERSYLPPSTDRPCYGSSLTRRLSERMHDQDDRRDQA